MPEFPRSASYDPQWMLDNAMGPNPLWLTESLTSALRLEAGMRVLDLGCGRDGWRHWLLWDEVGAETGSGPRPDLAEVGARMNMADAGRTFGLARVVARRR